MSNEIELESNKLKKQLDLLSQNVNKSVYNQRKYLLGRVLTVVDAVSSDPEQRKAIKDVVQDLFYQGNYLQDIKWHFSQVLEANGLPALPDDTVISTEEPLNIYEKV